MRWRNLSNCHEIKRVSLGELKNMLEDYRYFFVLGADLAVVHYGKNIPSNLGSLGYAIKLEGEHVKILAWLKAGELYKTSCFTLQDFVVDPSFIPEFVKISQVISGENS